MKRVFILIFSILAIPLGIFMFVFGEYDDSPGAQGLGVVVGILGIVGIVRRRRGKQHIQSMKTILVDAYNTFIVEGQGINVEMQQLLDTYPNPKIILTNANDAQMVQFGLDKVPYRVFTLKHNPDKVDPVYYKMMLQEYTLTSQDVVYFEHNAQAVESAKSVGIVTHHYDKDAKDLGALQKFLEKNL